MRLFTYAARKGRSLRSPSLRSSSSSEVPIAASIVSPVLSHTIRIVSAMFSSESWVKIEIICIFDKTYPDPDRFFGVFKSNRS